MPRDLSQVLHYFLPELEPKPDALDSGEGSRTRPVPPRGSARLGVPRHPTTESATGLPLSILGVPIGERDVVHAAFTWNLAVEIARQGGAVAIVAPEADRTSPLWCASAPDRYAPELVYCAARAASDLYDVANERAAALRRSGRRGGIVFVRVPPAWLDETASPTHDAMRWLLLFTSPRREDGHATFERVKRLAEHRPGVEVGVTVHGVQRIEDAREAFDELARRCRERLGLALASYGLLTDDLDVYRAIAAGRAIGSTHPRSPASRALIDVARLLYEDARSRLLG